MSGGRSLAMSLVGLSLALVGGACGKPPATTPTQVGAQVGQIGVALPAALDDTVAQVRIDVAQNGKLVATQNVQRASVADTTSGFPAGDAFFVLPPGLYDVAATPLAANGEPAKDCAPATGNAQVASGLTTEIVLTIACKGPGSGGLDVVVKTSEPPVITSLA